MTLRPLPLLGALSALLGSFLVTEAASAQQFVVVQQQEPDGVRFRGGVGLEVGGLFITNLVGANLGAIGVQSQLGVQLNRNWGVYATPGFDIAFGDGTGVTLGAGVLADYTFTGIPIGVAAGPTFGTLLAVGGDGGGAAGVYYGAKLRGAWYPIMVQNGFRRKALYVSLDLSILGFGVSNGVETVSTGIILVSPMASVGYQAF